MMRLERPNEQDAKRKAKRQKGCRALLSVNKLILSDTNSFVDKERQQAAQLHQLRCDERDRTNRMLKEKLQRQKGGRALLSVNKLILSQLS